VVEIRNKSGETIRERQNEVELAQLSEQLLAIVNQTMQPAQVSLWLRPPQRRNE